MLMCMVLVWHVRMHVANGFVAVRVTVRPHRHRRVEMEVVAVVVSVGMFVLQRVV